MKPIHKVAWLTLGLLMIGGVFLRAAIMKSISKEKPKPENWSSTGAGVTVSEPDWGSPFDMNYVQDVEEWVSPDRIKKLSPQRAAELAEKIYLAKGQNWYDDDDEEAVKAVFAKMVQDGVEVALISRKFHWLYQKDMWEFLNSLLDESEIEQYVSVPIRSLPPFQKAQRI